MVAVTCEKDVGMGLCMLRHAIPTLVFLLFGTPSLHLFFEIFLFNFFNCTDYFCRVNVRIVHDDNAFGVDTIEWY